LKPARGNNSRDPVSEKPNTKRANGVAQGKGPEFKPQYRKKKGNRTLAGFALGWDNSNIFSSVKYILVLLIMIVTYHCIHTKANCLKFWSNDSTKSTHY
jgi:hypothetical protein